MQFLMNEYHALQCMIAKQEIYQSLWNYSIQTLILFEKEAQNSRRSVVLDFVGPALLLIAAMIWTWTWTWK